MPVGDLLTDDVPVRLIGDATVTVTGAGLDSRRVEPGDLYAALPGAHVHGARFVAQALAAGARAVLTDPAGVDLIEQHPEAQRPAVPVLVTDDPRALLGHLSATVYGTPAQRLRAIGITGTNGKTTTAYILDAALRALGSTTGLIGTIETRVGDRRVASERTTPESCDLHGLLALMVEDSVDVVTMEVSSHALELHRVDGVRYDVACFTNFSQDHLDFHDTMEEYFAAKAELFTPQRARRGVVCVDDDWGARLARDSRIDVVTLANSDARDADWVIRAEAGAAAFDLLGPDGARLALTSPLPGDFNRTNTALAALVLIELGVARSDVESALAGSVSVPGRAERVDLGPYAPTVVVDFAHTPDAVASVLDALRAGTTGALVAVLGAGGDRDPGKRPAMGASAATHADIVVVTDDNPRREDPAAIRAALLTGAREVAGESTQVQDVAGRDTAIETALRLAGSGGTVAILGKGHETGQEIGESVEPHDDREAARAAWARLTKGAS
ncbi:MAG: UDP-N-acetylmuramoyl-L-alanyl-D-glutamate--2,6-diaminopimelate ligase [Mobilicoccus sp.]|nr:UDP-N-acetylmuramoyl-L-alanyl-D-glutamate--2,6-diaminopimelate ligase [Mobilicoccus sp.]